MAARFLKGIHWPILILTLLLTGLGIMTIYSASFRGGTDYAAKQLFWALVGIGIFVSTLWIGYRYFLNLSYTFYVLTIVLLIGVFFFGPTISGARRWLVIGSLQIQPSELCKIATILTLANFLASRSALAEQKRTLAVAFFLVALPVLLILKQPDLGSSLVFIPVLIAVVFFWGIRFRYTIFLILSGLAAVPFAWHGLKPYQQKRLLVFLNPQVDPIGASYTAIQSKIAVGSGGLLGKGWLQGTQTQLDFVPEHHTDFIFSVLGEEFGFVGALFIVLLFGLLIAYALDIMQHTTDVKARFLAVGVAAFFSFQAFVNIGMTIGLAPITGLTLPFISYGGSSLVMSFFAVGLLASIYKERSIF